MKYHEITGHSFPHGIMFHHFHDAEKHYKSEGSITAGELQQIIDFIGKENILDPSEWVRKANSGSLSSTDVCFSFDDSLKCQVEVAVPVLRRNACVPSFLFTPPF
jgi:hypothetical protein